MAKKLNHLEDDSRPSFEQIAKMLEDRLHLKCGRPDEHGHGSVLTIPYNDFCIMSGRTQLRKRLYMEIEQEASRIGLIVAFGWNAVIVATDDDFAPDGWSTLGVHQPRPARPVVRAPKRPKRTSS